MVAKRRKPCRLSCHGEFRMSFARPFTSKTLGLPLVALAILAGCSAPVPPSPQAAWKVTFSDTGPDCTIAQHNAVVGDVTDSLRRVLVVDGVDNADVQCTVSGNSSFRVSNTSALDQGRALSISIASITTTATQEMPATGSVAYSSERTGGDTYFGGDPTPCNFYFIPGTNEGVGPGKIWVAFDCPKVTSENSTCAISQGFAIFENCADQ